MYAVPERKLETYPDLQSPFFPKKTSYVEEENMPCTTTTTTTTGRPVMVSWHKKYMTVCLFFVVLSMLYITVLYNT